MFVFTIKCSQNSKSHKIVGIQIKLVHEISSQDVRNCCGLWVLIRSLVFICMCIHKLWNITLWVGINIWVPKIF